MSIPVRGLGDPMCLKNGALSKRIGSNPVTFSGFGEGHHGPLKVWPTGSLKKYFVRFCFVKLGPI